MLFKCQPSTYVRDRWGRTRWVRTRLGAKPASFFGTVTSRFNRRENSDFPVFTNQGQDVSPSDRQISKTILSMSTFCMLMNVENCQGGQHTEYVNCTVLRAMYIIAVSMTGF